MRISRTPLIDWWGAAIRRTPDPLIVAARLSLANAIRVVRRAATCVRPPACSSQAPFVVFWDAAVKQTQCPKN